MASIIVTFKGRALNSLNIDRDVVSIGRDPHNTLTIDSLAIAPHHAIIRPEDGAYSLEPVADGYPTIVNGQPVNQCVLQHGDRIDIGKHTLYFSDKQFISQLPPLQQAQPEGTETLVQESSLTTPRATLQILTGSEIGLIIPLHQAMTRLQHQGVEVAVIVREESGFVVCCMGDDVDLAVNGEGIGVRSETLKEGDLIRLNQCVMQFHLAKPRGGRLHDFK